MDKLCLGIKLWNFKVQKSGQILCAHKHCFLMPGHIYSHMHVGDAAGILHDHDI